MNNKHNCITTESNEDDPPGTLNVIRIVPPTSGSGGGQLQYLGQSEEKDQMTS